MKPINGQYYSPAPLINLTPNDLNEILRAAVTNHMNTDFKAIDDSIRAAVINFMLNGDAKPWFLAYMNLKPDVMEKCYQSIIDEIEGSAVELCNKVEDAFNEIWGDVAYCEA